MMVGAGGGGGNALFGCDDRFFPTLMHGQPAGSSLYPNP